MSDIDSFASSLWEQSKRFLEKAGACASQSAEVAFLNSAIMLGFAALEAHINAVAEELSNSANVSVHDRGILREREVRIENGIFRLASASKFYRVEDRLLFLHAKFGDGPLDRKVSWWADLQTALKLRNDLTHPKVAAASNRSDVERALSAIVDALNALYVSVYKTPFPSFNRRLHSNMDF